MPRFRQTVQKLLAAADIQIDGGRAWDIQVNDDRFFRRVLSQGSLGLGESYVDGWWDAPALDEFFTHLLGADLDRQARHSARVILALAYARLFNPQHGKRAFVIGERHYDIGNDLYEAMLDRRLVYTCGYWKNAATLDEAQEAKLDLVCRKLNLQPGQTVLDIGCGWGSFLQYAAEKYGARGVGITVSNHQAELARERCRGRPIEIKVADYRSLSGQFDHIVSLGMFEHVGYKNYRTYMEVAGRSLKDNGLFLLHTIGGNQSTKSFDPWIEKYIFPNSMLPSIAQIGRAIEGLFVMEDWHNFSVYYDQTLLAWFNNFNSHWAELKPRYGECFYRMWKYYLMASAGTFRCRKNQLWQIVLSKRGVPGGYVSVR